jgi:hypothetical protein
LNNGEQTGKRLVLPVDGCVVFSHLQLYRDASWIDYTA